MEAASASQALQRGWEHRRALLRQQDESRACFESDALGQHDLLQALRAVEIREGVAVARVQHGVRMHDGLGAGIREAAQP